MFNRNDELRKLRIGSLDHVCKILETNGDWKKLMAIIPKDLSSEKSQLKYSTDEIRQVEDYARSTGKLAAEVLFEEWGTSGRVRPTLGALLHLIAKTKIFKAGDEIADMIKEPPPERPDDGPAARIDTDNFTELLNATHIKKNPKKHNQATGTTAQLKPNFLKSIGSKPTASVKDIPSTRNHEQSESNNSAYIPNFDKLMYPRPAIHIDTTILQNKELIKFGYEELKAITSDFSDDFIHGPQGPTGKIGSGAFGDVYAGSHSKHGVLAIKKFKNLTLISADPERVVETFNDEVKCLSQLRHKNIVPIVGYSVEDGGKDSPFLCVVTEYVGGGSLDQNLCSKKLTEVQRINILVGTAMGIRYIHNRSPSDEAIPEKAPQSPMHYIHGDIKSANILLTMDYQPKVCDFGLAKQFNTTFVTREISGSTPYMSPERHKGTFTQKSDIYSFGVVILEILTGLSCTVSTRQGSVHVYDYIKDRVTDDDISKVLDPFASPWTKAKELYELANKCLISDYRVRPNIVEVCEDLNKILEF